MNAEMGPWEAAGWTLIVIVILVAGWRLFILWQRERQHEVNPEPPKEQNAGAGEHWLEIDWRGDQHKEPDS